MGRNNMIAGLILAAGESIRMGSPKALLQIQGRTFVEHIAQQMAHSGLEPVLVVAGAHFAEIRDYFGQRKEFSLIENLQYQQGQLSSLQEGLRRLPKDVVAAIAWPVDLPLVHADTVRSLVQSYQSQKKAIVVPAMKGRHGHPVLYGPAAIPAILHLGKTQTARDLRAQLPGEIVYVDVNDPGILIDIDTPEDYRAHVSDR